MLKLVEKSDGTKEWFAYDPWDRLERHRTDGPAIERADGGYEWYYGGKLHREDGPAIKWADGKLKWFLNGKSLTRMQHFHLSPYWRAQPESEQIFYLMSMESDDG